MKAKLFSLCAIAAAVIAIVAAILCKRNNSDPAAVIIHDTSIDVRTDTLTSFILRGKVKQVIMSNYYWNGGATWDSLNKTPVPVKLYRVDTVNYNSAGHITRSASAINRVTNAELNATGNYVKIIESKLSSYSATIYEYDDKNRVAKSTSTYSNSIVFMGNQYLQEYLFAGDSIHYQENNPTPLFSAISSNGQSKSEYIYDKTAKFVTVIVYAFSGDAIWRENYKKNIPLNDEGYMDDNVIHKGYPEKPAAVSFENDLDRKQYVKTDTQGNWVETYSYFYYADIDYHEVRNYSIRKIAYF